MRLPLWSPAGENKRNPFPGAAYYGLRPVRTVYEFIGGSGMCNNGFGGGNCCWIIILLIIIWCCCGNGSWGGSGCGGNCGCNNNCGCNPPSCC